MDGTNMANPQLLNVSKKILPTIEIRSLSEATNFEDFDIFNEEYTLNYQGERMLNIDATKFSNYLETNLAIGYKN